MGAVNRNIEIPGKPASKGLRVFFDFISEEIDKRKDSEFWRKVTDDGQWRYSDHFESPPMFVAFRAWKHGNSHTRDAVEDWLSQSWNYKGQRKELYQKLVQSLWGRFRDPRPEWQYYADDVFSFERQGYEQAWSSLRDLQMLARGVGLKGLVLLFDEFEDILTNLTNVAYQEAAFWNLFQFSLGKKYPGLSYYAVTPDFVGKCHVVLERKGRSKYCVASFDSLPTFQLAPLSIEDLETLAIRIMRTHGLAYSWEPDLVMRASKLRALISEAAAIQIADRSRQAIIRVVKALDSLLYETE